MSAIPTSFAPMDDLSVVLDELTTQAEAVQMHVHVVRSKHHAYKMTADPVEKNGYIVILREHGEALETDLGIIKLNAELITDERLAKWVAAARSAAEMQTRKKRLQVLTAETQSLESAMADLRERMV